MKSSYPFKIGIIILIIAFFILSNSTPFSKEIKNFFYFISSPIQRWLWSAGLKLSDFFATISEIKTLKKENEELKLKIQNLISENSSLKELKKENEILRTALNLGLEKEFELKMARVIGKEISQDYLIIDKGEKDGLEKGLAVITQQKALVGKIGDVYNNFSSVQLLTSKNNSFDVKMSEKEIYGLAKGKGNFKLSLDLIPKEKEIEVGDRLVTSAGGGIFPNGLLVGEISRVKKSDIEPFQEIEIKPTFDVKDLDLLFIIKW